MQEESIELDEKKSSLAMAIARGQSIEMWARKNDVAERTAYRWAKDPEVQRASDTWRRHALNRVIGRMTRQSRAAVDGIAHIARTGESDSVRLAAWRAILTEQMAVAKFSNLEHRVAEVEAGLGIDKNGRPVGPS